MIYIPNTFTPNNDGYNDTWKIEGLDGDESVIVKVFNRSGEMVYRSTGHQSPWDGVYKGKKLPNGTYYYIINAQKGVQTLSGSVTIIN
nr:gliding motility-associated C-terminal domain-containing protein [uncultured Mucilaginibacter sp.]